MRDIAAEPVSVSRAYPAPTDKYFRMLTVAEMLFMYPYSVRFMFHLRERPLTGLSATPALQPGYNRSFRFFIKTEPIFSSRADRSIHSNGAAKTEMVPVKRWLDREASGVLIE